MKMKDRFPEVFQVNGNPSFGVQNCVWTTFGEDEQSTADQDSAIEYAVLNHDRMAEEIAELKVVLRLLIGKGIDLLNVEDVSDEEDAASVHANFNDAIIKSEQLLAKLNQEWEE